uniref:Uncharacterized protein n=1 Tax=Physcomitrium patens TaxID=3218 RepID=A0A2K1L1E4_PHYPA|nr:hypothetical protein PHYPA_002641 [Physcomitrium patens]
MEKSADLFRPKLLVTVASAYPWHYDYARVRQVGCKFDNQDMWHIDAPVPLLVFSLSIALTMLM